MAQSSTRGTCVVEAVWLGVHAGVTVLWMVAHPAIASRIRIPAARARCELRLCINSLLPKLIVSAAQIASPPTKALRDRDRRRRICRAYSIWCGPITPQDLLTGVVRLS